MELMHDGRMGSVAANADAAIAAEAGDALARIGPRTERRG
jgi:hypothetical protein